MRKRYMRPFVLACAVGIVLSIFIGRVHAVCTNPTGTEKDQIYNSLYHVKQYCDNTNWQTIGGGCRYAPPSGSGYFVMTKTTYNGNLGGLAGADALCLSELTANTDWKGYSDASSRGLLIAAKVKAFLCVAGTCRAPNASTTYYFATVGDSRAGGASFTTNSSAVGPNDSANWAATDHFNSGVPYWTGRGSNGGGTNTTWLTGTAFQSCSAWATAANTATGIIGTPATTVYTRWGNSWQSVADCSLSLPLICIVNP